MFSTRSSSPTGARSPFASLARVASWASDAWPSTRTSMLRRRHVDVADEAIHLPGVSPADTYLDVEASSGRRPVNRGRGDPSRLRLPRPRTPTSPRPSPKQVSPGSAPRRTRPGRWATRSPLVASRRSRRRSGGSGRDGARRGSRDRSRLRPGTRLSAGDQSGRRRRRPGTEGRAY